MSRKEEMIEQQELDQLLYAEKSEVSRLSARVDSLISEFKESKQHMLQLSMDLARETGKFSIEIERLSDVLDKMQIQIGKLVEMNMKRGIIIEWVKSSPKFLSVIFGMTSILGVFFTSNAYKDSLHYFLSIEKTRQAAHVDEHEKDRINNV